MKPTISIERQKTLTGPVINCLNKMSFVSFGRGFHLIVVSTGLIQKLELRGIHQLLSSTSVPNVQRVSQFYVGYYRAFSNILHLCSRSWANMLWEDLIWFVRIRLCLCLNEHHFMYVLQFLCDSIFVLLKNVYMNEKKICAWDFIVLQWKSKSMYSQRLTGVLC